LNATRISVGRRRGAAVLLTVAWLTWWHHWSPVLLVAAGVAWLVIQKRVDDGRGERLGLAWRRAWPPDAAILLGLIGVGAITFALDNGPTAPKVVPTGLHAVALSILMFGAWWRRAFVALPRALGGDGPRRA
jgi:hypothetical protein